MKRLRLLPYTRASGSARALAKAVKGLRVSVNANFIPNPRQHLIVNWGNHTVPRWWGARGTTSLNHPANVAASANKLTALQRLSAGGVSVPTFTTSRQDALAWCHEGRVVVARRMLNSHSGRGCIVWEKGMNPDDLVQAQLYTLHLRHKREFRIHVFNGAVIDRQEKLRARDATERDAWIRSHDKGYVFARGGIQVPPVVEAEAIRAVATLGLDFGAVDVAYREKENRPFVFEVNTAPGMEGQTITSYANAIRRIQSL